jgi:DNA gyrase subunit A
MARRGAGSSGGDDGQQLTFGQVDNIDLQEEMERSFLEYAMSVIVSRALPDARDGLKPVHRRILYAMHDLGFRPDRPHVKCAKVTGETMANYHPHGDGAIYAALTRMAQPFSLLHPLIDFHGNYGSPDFAPAASRYTECRLAPLTQSLLAGIDEDTVDFDATYDGRDREPKVLPARFPNLLVNGSEGIAVGMATRIPPHNLGEVIDATIHLIDHPDATPDDLMEFVKGPDFPTGGQILGRAGIMEAYRTGRGSIRLRGVAEIQDGKRGAQIVISEMPYQTSVGSIANRIKELVDSRELEGIRDIENLSAGHDTRLVIYLKRDANANVVLNKLYKNTPLQTSFPVNMVALVDGVPRTLNLAQALSAYIDHQIEVITRRSQYRLAAAEARAHIVEGMLRALDMIDRIIELIKGSADRGAARDGLMAAPFSFSEIQANHILDMTLSRLTRLGRDEYEAEMARLRETIAELQSILGDEGKLRGVIKTEMGEVREKFGKPRRSPIGHDPGDMDAEDLIEDRPVVFVMTKAGYVKTVAAEAFRTQGRGGRGVQGAKVREEDLVTHISLTSTHAFLLFFSTQGRVFRLKAHEIPMKERTARGTAIVNLLPLRPEERIQTVIDTRDYPEDRYLVFATRQGQVKKTSFSEYDKSRREGFIAISLRNGDELVRVVQTTGSDDIFMVSRKGQTIRFSEEEVRPMGRDAGGVRGMKLKEGDEVVSLDVPRDDSAILLVTDAGYGKRTQLDKFNPQGRGGQGVRGIKLTANKGNVVAAFMVGLDDEIFLISSAGVTMRTGVRSISSQGRDATGVRVMNLDQGHVVAAVSPIIEAPDSE